jgi:endonuclease/exonuclease/phosphatase family metal-dependent hydrolase
MFANDRQYNTKIAAAFICSVVILVISTLMILSSCARVEILVVPEIMSFAVGGEQHFDEDSEILKVMTLNLGHGKGRGVIQEFVSNNKTRENLDKVAALLERERPHVAAFQEADIESRRSGNFNHVYYISERAGYGQAIQGEHVKGLGLNHGTALISRLQMSEPLSVAFDPKLPSPDKGFVACTVEFGTSGTKVDVVSVHLDFASKATRNRQALQMADYLSGRSNPLVVMGDFNCQAKVSEELFKIFSDELSLSAYELYSKELETFPSLGRRIDWILISPELEFRSYTVLEDRVSDHLAVVSELVKAE